MPRKNDAELRLISTIFSSRQKKNNELYTRFSGIMIPKSRLNKAIKLYNERIVSIDTIYHAHRTVLDPKSKDFEDKLILVANAHVRGKMSMETVQVKLITYGIVDAFCEKCGRKSDGQDRKDAAKLCEHEIAVLKYIDDYLVAGNEYFGADSNNNLKYYAEVLAGTRSVDSLKLVSRKSSLESRYLGDFPGMSTLIDRVTGVFLSDSCLWSSDKRIKAVILDVMPEKRLEKNIIRILIDEGINEDLEIRKDIEGIANRYISILVYEYGVGMEVARSIAYFWIICYERIMGKSKKNNKNLDMDI
ncbi:MULTISPECIES: hypothetical protein [unclassified Butyrivibrio]|uniref:hypothetical protein n=1 Tax=unclassified Butyrivibrio TaxID=2639466 RepID=UPI000415428F|nr:MULTISPECIES: hypothetical protein [unclassified Butyrivibrio]